MRENIQELFKGTPTEESLRRAINNIDNHIESIRSISNDPRISQKIKFSIKELKWKREKLLEKLSNI